MDMRLVGKLYHCAVVDSADYLTCLDLFTYLNAVAERVSEVLVDRYRLAGVSYRNGLAVKRIVPHLCDLAVGSRINGIADLALNVNAEVDAPVLHSVGKDLRRRVVRRTELTVDGENKCRHNVSHGLVRRRLGRVVRLCGALRRACHGMRRFIGDNRWVSRSLGALTTARAVCSRCERYGDRKYDEQCRYRKIDRAVDAFGIVTALALSVAIPFFGLFARRGEFLDLHFLLLTLFYQCTEAVGFTPVFFAA